MEWGHPLIRPVRVQGTGQFFDFFIHRATARNLPSPHLPHLSLSSRSRSPHLMPTSLMGQDHAKHKPSLLMLPALAVILLR